MADKADVGVEVPRKDTKESTLYHYEDKARGINVPSKIVYKDKDYITTFPFYQNRKTNEIKPKYSFDKISFEGLKRRFPAGFLKNAKSGYGVTSQLKPLVKFIEKRIGPKELVVSATRKTQMQGDVFIVNLKDVESAGKYNAALRRLHKEKNNVFLNNKMAGIFPTEFEQIKAKYQKGTIYQTLSDYDNIEKSLSADDRLAIMGLFGRVSATSEDLVERQALATTREKIEEKIIEDVLAKYKRLLNSKAASEERWQEFFKSNAWIFTQLFAYPTVLFKDKAYVGGKSIQDKEGKVVDFLYTNKLTRNSALVEIKKHTTKLLQSKPYRGSDVYCMHKELSGAINQVLDQKDTYAKKFDSIREGSAAQSFNPKCIVVIGRISSLGDKQHKAFELLRSSFKDIEIITFDELYERVALVLSIFKRDEKGATKPNKKRGRPKKA